MKVIVVGFESIMHKSPTTIIVFHQSMVRKFLYFAHLVSYQIKLNFVCRNTKNETRTRIVLSTKKR